MSPELKKFIVHCYFGKFFHVEKIVESLYKKYDCEFSESEVQNVIDAVDQFISALKV